MKALETALGSAIERVARLYEQHPEPRPDVNGEEWTSLEGKIGEAIATENESKALAAIAAWERHAEETLR